MFESGEAVARAFFDRWNDGDAYGIGALFVEDADFVNVVGLWWRSRKAKREQSGMPWDYRVNAGGMEPQLDELRHRYYQDLRDCHARLLDRFDEDAIQRVYIQRKK